MKEVTSDYIIDRTDDFKECFECGCINWYENETCINCNHDNFIDVSKENIDLMKELQEQTKITV